MPKVQRFGTLRNRSIRFDENGSAWLDIKVTGAGFDLLGAAPAENTKAFQELASAQPGDRIWFWGQRQSNPTDDDANGTLVIAERAKVTARAAGATLTEDGDTVADLTVLKGVGAAMAERLRAVGIITVRDMAGVSDDQIDALDGAVCAVRGGLKRYDVVAQAKAIIAEA